MDIEVTKQTANEIMKSAEKLGEVRDIASAILAIEDVRDESDRMTIINSLGHRLLDIGLESSVIWVKAHDIWVMAIKEGELKATPADISNKTPEQELAELEEVTADDLPFC